MGQYLCVGNYVEGRVLNCADRVERGWITSITKNNDNKITSIKIKTSDNIGSAVSVNLLVKSVFLCNYVKDWKSALNRHIINGTLVRHFKGNTYRVIGVINSVDGGQFVLYESIKDPNKRWIREYAEFMSKVDKEKYPNAKQLYRFEVFK